MAPIILTRSRNGKKPDSKDNNKTTAPAFTPKRHLARTPPPSDNPPIAGTPLTIQPNKTPTAQPDEALATQPNKAPTAQPEKALTTQLNEGPTTQPDTEPAPSRSTTVSPQNATSKISLDNAMNALNIALAHVSEAYQKTIANLNQNEDHSHIMVETPFHAFEEIGNKLHSDETISPTTKSKSNRIRRILQSTRANT